MLKRNLDDYLEKYQDISSHQLTRINDYLSQCNFTEKDFKKLDKELDRIASIEHEIIKMIFYIIPESTPRPRLNMMHGNFYVKNASSNNQFMKLVVNKEEDIFKYIHTPCKFKCRLYFPIPSTMNKVDKLLAELGAIRPVNNKDWDNLGKTYSDMIQKWLLFNDALIVKGVSEKYYSFKPRVEIEIDYLLDYDCNFNKKHIESTKVYKRDNNIQ